MQRLIQSADKVLGIVHPRRILGLRRAQLLSGIEVEALNASLGDIP
jgi:hypothetical protein